MYGLGPNDRAVAYVGGLAAIKGIFPLLESVRQLLPRYPNLKIIAPGAVMPPPGSLKGRLARATLPWLGLARDYERAESILRDPALGGAFRRSGFVHDILPVLAAAEFLVFPSTVPHFARPVVEAAMVARPAIGSDLAGVRDLIDDGKTGRLVPAGDAHSLAAAVGAWLDHPDEVRALGITARARARERFDAGHQIERVLGIYSRVLELHRAAPNGMPQPA
jgi:glycosyltransferase involved in cell wall biosynthesis